ncbi:hypothetical protein C8Q77DRAFT_659061 [Trametes polyzona]|nr:hypothetical protein C8Q77DRAFT_659061 [Trametes polyzona]
MARSTFACASEGAAQFENHDHLPCVCVREKLEWRRRGCLIHAPVRAALRVGAGWEVGRLWWVREAVVLGWGRVQLAAAVRSGLGRRTSRAASRPSDRAWAEGDARAGERAGKRAASASEYELQPAGGWGLGCLLPRCFSFTSEGGRACQSSHPIAWRRTWNKRAKSRVRHPPYVITVAPVPRLSPSLIAIEFPSASLHSHLFLSWPACPLSLSPRPFRAPACLASPLSRTRLSNVLVRRTSGCDGWRSDRSDLASPPCLPAPLRSIAPSVVSDAPFVHPEVEACIVCAAMAQYPDDPPGLLQKG